MRKTKTHKEFIEELLEKNDAYRAGEFWMLGEYEGGKIKILLENKYGRLLTQPRTLLSNMTPDIQSAVNSTEYFKKQLLENSDAYREGSFSVIGEYLDSRTKILLSDKYGEMLSTSGNLLNNRTPDIKVAVDKTAYWKKMLLEKNSTYRSGEFWILGNYVGGHSSIAVENKYGKMTCTPSNLLQNRAPTIQSAIDKVSYWRKYIEDVRGALYYYTEANFKGTYNLVDIGCKVHGLFSQSPASHQQGTGCPKCAEEELGFRRSVWIKGDKVGKLYIIKCTNDVEEFYKLGITKQTVKQRYHSKKAMPYEKNLNVFLEEASDKGYIWDKERYLKRALKAFQYHPKINFGGAATECFTKEGLPEILKLIEAYK